MNSHLLQCPRKREAQRKTITELRAYLETLKTATTVAEAICNGVEEFLTEGEQRSGRQTQGVKTKAAAQGQSKIGWDKAMRGILSKKWGEICFEVPDNNKQMQCATWTSLVSLWLTRESRKYWTVRNEETQSLSSPEEKDKSRARALAEAGVRELYAREMETTSGQGDTANTDCETTNAFVTANARMGASDKRGNEQHDC
jgi:hypothetical protein